MDLLDMTIINVAIPQIMIQFGSDIDLVQYVITAYMVHWTLRANYCVFGRYTGNE